MLSNHRYAPKQLSGVYSGTVTHGGPMIEAYRLNRDLGNIYLSNLDFCGVRKLVLRGPECLGPPVGYTGDARTIHDPATPNMTVELAGLRRCKAMMHKDPQVSKLILGDLDILLGSHADSMSNGNYFPGYKMMINMVSRSKNLEEIIYTGVREDVPQAAMDILAKPWKEFSKTKHDDGTVRKPIKVYVETVWYRAIPNSGGRVASGVSGGPRILLFESS
jgi:hypothetical protein